MKIFPLIFTLGLATPRMTRLTQMCRRRCTLADISAAVCAQTFCNSDEECQDLWLRPDGVTVTLDPSYAVLIGCEAAATFVMQANSDAPIILPTYPPPTIPSTGGLFGALAARRDQMFGQEDSDDDHGTIVEYNTNIVDQLNSIFSQLERVPFKTFPYNCVTDQLFTLNSKVDELLELPAGFFDKSTIMHMEEVVEWQQWMGIMFAIISNKPDLSNPAVKFAKSIITVYLNFLRFAEVELIEFDSAFATAIAGIRTVTQSSVLRVLFGNPMRLTNSASGTVVLESSGPDRIPNSLKFIHSFVTASSPLQVNRQICQSVGISILSVFDAGLLTTAQKALISVFVSKCAQYVEYDQAAIAPYINRASTMFFVEYPVKTLIVNPRNTFEEGIAKIATLKRTEFTNEISPIVAYSNSAAIGNGPRMEWVGKLVRSGFNPANNLFEFSDEGQLFFKPKEISHLSHAARKNVLHKYHQFGRLIGLGLRDQLTLQISFTPSAVALLAGLTEDEILAKDAFWQAENAEHYTMVAKLRIEIPEGLAFTDSEDPVTIGNLEAYIEETRSNKLFRSIGLQMASIREGIYEVLPYGSLQTFSVSALSLRLRGVVVIDVEQLIASMSYTPIGFGDSPEVTALHASLRSFSQETLRKFLQFVVGAPLPPVTGIPEQWIKVVADVSAGVNYLPTSSTCFKTLKLPHYDSAAILNVKLVYAIQNALGIELS